MSTQNITLRWDDTNEIEQGYKVYRSKSPMDINNMPPPIATLNANTTEYVDMDQPVGDINYYRVGAYLNGLELYSDEVEIQVSSCGEETILHITTTSTFSVYWQVSKQTCFKDFNATVPVENDGDPVLSIKDSSDQNLILILNSSTGGSYREDPNGDYVQYESGKDYYVSLPVNITYPWTVSAWMDNRYWDGTTNNHNYISIANPNSSVDQILVVGLRNDFNDSNNNPAIATNIGGFVSRFFNTNDDQFSMVAVFDNTSSFTVNSSSNVSDTYSRSAPVGSHVLSVGALRRSTYGASESTGRLKTLFISNYKPSNAEIDDLHKFNRCKQPIQL